MATHTIADVLHLAADHWLSCGPSEKRPNVRCFSCDAVMYALKSLGCNGKYYEEAASDTFTLSVFKYLTDLGCNCHSSIQFDYDGFDDSDQKQGARYAWLKFAAMLAEEEGI